MTNEQLESERVITMFVLVAYLLIIISIFLFYWFDFQVNKNIDLVDSLTGLATAALAYFAFRIQKNQLKIQENQAITQKSQAITQLNQAFNDVNKIILTNKNSKLKDFATRVYAVDEREICKKYDEDIETIALTFIILNAYESNYINNLNAFTEEEPRILKNLLNNYAVADKILNYNSYDPGFKAICEKLKNYKKIEGL